MLIWLVSTTEDQLTFIKSPESAKVLAKHKNGWFGQHAIDDICEVANKATGPDSKLTFKDCFKCEPSHPTYGYNSWDGMTYNHLVCRIWSST